MLKALLWDVDGTLAETERDGHRVAFNRAFEAEGLPWRWDELPYGELLGITGGRERLLHDMASRCDAPELPHERLELATRLHRRKNAFYAEIVDSGAIALRDGVRELMQECLERGVRMGITTTTSRSNVDALLRRHLGAAWTKGFDAIVCGEDTARKKPDPEVYVRALAQLRLGPLEAVAIEDSPGGVAAAVAADVPVIVARSAYFAAVPVHGAIAIGPGLHQRAGWRPVPRSATAGAVGLDDLIDWHRRMELVSAHG
jgi:HAD superfamily hydrolase (TIGR01509 family)